MLWCLYGVPLVFTGEGGINFFCRGLRLEKDRKYMQARHCRLQILSAFWKGYTNRFRNLVNCLEGVG